MLPTIAKNMFEEWEVSRVESIRFTPLPDVISTTVEQMTLLTLMLQLPGLSMLYAVRGPRCATRHQTPAHRNTVRAQVLPALYSPVRLIGACYGAK